ncbi:MAG: DUF2436 domain-containing protein [Dysgonamonadaceae bacterium]|nr:DUF2436 domain-containing protein [Dysgonamonadaceae bacterium]
MKAKLFCPIAVLFLMGIFVPNTSFSDAYFRYWNYIPIFMKRLIILLMVAVVFGGTLTAQNSKSSAYLLSVNGTETSLNQKKNLSTNPVDPQFFERSKEKGQREVTMSRENGETILTPKGKVNHELFRTRPSAEKEAFKAIPRRAYSSVTKSASDAGATITLKVIGNPWGDGTGFQMLLDADHVMDPSTATFDELYAMSEYKIPEGATSDLTNPIVVFDDEVSITVPGGTYDILFLNPDPNNGRIWITQWASDGSPALGDDFVFKSGFTYTFIFEFGGYVEYYPEYDAALSGMVLPLISINLTNSEPVIVTLSNPGEHAFSSVDLSYQVNDGNVVTETYTGTLNPGENLTYTFNTKADFSAEGFYNVTAWVTYSNDMNPVNNRVSGQTKHPAPLALPFVSKFDFKEELAANWTIINANGGSTWHYDSFNPDADGGIGALQVNTFDVGNGVPDDYLVSDPLIFPAKGAYNITFQLYIFSTESFRILYGASSNPEEMDVLVDYPALSRNSNWPLFAKNFEISVPGNYYFAFHYYSNAAIGSAIDLDNVNIAQGTFVGVPDITIPNTIVPTSSCTLSSGNTLSATVKNQGSEPISEFKLTYKVNDNPVVSQTFNVLLDTNESKTVEFTQKADFSEIGNYTILLTAATPNEVNTSNNQTEAEVSHFAPVTNLPFESNFFNPADIKNWNSTVYGGWGMNNYYSCYYPNGENIPLLSRCITLLPGDYRFSLTYSSGFSYSMTFTDDFYIAYGPSGSDPMTWTPVKEYFDNSTGGVNSPVSDDIILHVTQAGEYEIAIVSTRHGDLAIYNTSVAILPEHDVRIKGIESPASFARQTPKYQLNGFKTFNAIVHNRGKNAETGTIEFKLNNDLLALVDFNLSSANETKTVPVNADIASLPVGPLNLQFKATITDTDATPGDNSIQIAKYVSDSTYVWDSIDSDFQDGIGLNGQVGAFGLIYELGKKDVLTSINVGLFGFGQTDDFGIAVYPVDDDFVLGTPYFTQVYARNAGSSVTFDVPDTELDPGKYFFEVQQLARNNIAIAFDQDPTGYFYGNWGNGEPLELIGSGYGFGYIHVRPNFGKGGVTGLVNVKVSDPQVKLYPNPVSDVLSVSVANQKIKRISVHNASGAVVYQNSKVNKSEHKLNTSNLASGFYFITVQTKAGVSTSKFVVK